MVVEPCSAPASLTAGVDYGAMGGPPLLLRPQVCRCCDAGRRSQDQHAGDGDAPPKHKGKRQQISATLPFTTRGKKTRNVVQRATTHTAIRQSENIYRYSGTDFMSYQSMRPVLAQSPCV